MKKFDIDPYEALKSIMEVTAPHLGEAFLKVVCEELKQLFDAQMVFITEAIDYNPTTQVKILYATDPNLPNDFELEGTPCQLVYKDQIIQIVKDVNIQFEKEKGTPFQSFYGIPIHNSQNACIGHIAIFSNEQREIPKEIEDIALIFTQRVETEYERLLLEIENKRILDELHYLSITDTLTQVHNRRFFNNKCAEIFTQVHRGSHHAALIFMDLDNFKNINDEHGHETGDFILQKVGNILKQECRQSIDFICRIGGEEFAIICLNSSTKNASKLSARIMEITKSFFQNQPYEVTFSVGIASFEDSNISWQEIYKIADTKMYAAKKAGKNCIKV